MRKITRVSAAAIAVLALGLTACSANNETSDDKSDSSSSSDAPKLKGTLNGGGASAQEAAQTAWGENFTKIQPDVTVQYASVGSGSGIKGFIGGQYAYAASDSALKDEEFEQTKNVCGDGGAMNIPVYISPIAVIVNIDGVDQPLKLDADTVAKIFKGEITKWNDDAIKAHNEGVDLPDAEITVVHRSDESGTTENFTKYLAAATDLWTEKPSKKWPIAGQESAQKTQGVVDLVGSTKNTIGYADASQIGNLNTVAIKVGDDYTEYSPEGAAKTLSVSERRGGGAQGDMAVEVAFKTTEQGAYPIIMVSYGIFCTEYQDANTADLVKAYGKYMVSTEGQRVSADAAGSAPLTEELSREATEAIDSITVK